MARPVQRPASVQDLPMNRGALHGGREESWQECPSPRKAACGQGTPGPQTACLTPWASAPSAAPLLLTLLSPG